MEITPSCKPETLLLGASCDIQYCFDCQMLHLNIGALTLRLSRHQFNEFIADLNQAGTNLKHREITSKNTKSTIRTLHS